MCVKYNIFQSIVANKKKEIVMISFFYPLNYLRFNSMRAVVSYA
jgi:hypothetical protein